MEEPPTKIIFSILSSFKLHFFKKNSMHGFILSLKKLVKITSKSFLFNLYSIFTFGIIESTKINASFSEDNKILPFSHAFNSLNFPGLKLNFGLFLR